MTVLWSPNSRNELKDFFKKEIERIIEWLEHLFFSFNSLEL